MNIESYAGVLRRRWRIMALCVALGLAAAVLATLVAEKEYRAQAQIFVSASTAIDITQLNQGNNFATSRVQSYTSIAASRAVTTRVVEDLDLSITPDQLADKISASAPSDKVLIDIAVSDTDAATAAELANAVAESFSRVVEELETTDEASTSPVKLTVTQPATAPTSPSSPRPNRNLALGLLSGLLVGAVGAVVRDRLDNTVKSADSLEKITKVPVLASVAFDRDVPRHIVAFKADAYGPRAEAYRQLRTNLQFVNVDARPRTIAVTSSLPGEGKTSTAINLAASLAESEFRVCLVEADLRRPNIAMQLGLIGDVGVTSVLTGAIDVHTALQQSGENLSVLTSGPLPPNPSELLASQNAGQMLRALADRFDFVIVDTAPLLPVSDGAEVASITDGTLMVVRAGRTTEDQLSKSLASLDNVGVQPFGILLNMAGPSAGGYGYGYTYSYRPQESPKRYRRSAR
jgi:capsular exopolysaccharide synthesis family protein